MACTSDLTTRKKTDIWLIGHLTSTLSQLRLPSINEVMRLFFYYKIIEKKNNNKSATCTACDVLQIWEKASIPTRLKKHVISKILKYFTEWQMLKKNKENKAKRSAVMINKEEKWRESLESLFDIAHANALKMITIEEDRLFLLGQREKGRLGQIGSLDRELNKKQAIKLKEDAKLECRKRRETENIKRLTEKCVLMSSSSSSIDDSNSDEAFRRSGSPLPGPSQRKKARNRIIDDRLAVSLDVAKVSDRKAALVLTSTLRSAGCDVASYSISSASIRRHRIQRRQKIAESLKSEFKPEVPLSIHWDGKMLEDITGHEVVDRLPILVSGKGIEQLLAVPKLPNGTGQAMASSVFETVLSWGLCDKIKSMVFDTTASNTGRINGACTLLEQKLEKNVLWLACRHHILEIVLEAIVVLAVGVSSGPEIQIFKRFQKRWPQINQENFKTVNADPEILMYVEDVSNIMISFATHQLKQFQPRDDYKELLNLTIIFLGGTPEKGVSFRAPAGLHRARWMAKAIYALKIYLFREQLKLTNREIKGIKDVCIFIVRIYIKYWFQAPCASSAPKNDLQLLKDLVAYEKINYSLAKAAMKKIMGHLWYLSEELVAFAFFDNEVSLKTKQRMVTALETPGIEDSPKRPTLDYDLILAKNLEDFVSNHTLSFFNTIGVSCDFLKKDVKTWKDDDNYNICRTFVHSMKVVNDIAERGVALMDEYNRLHTNNEEQKQYLLLTVKDYRRKFPNTKKSTLTS